MKELNNYIIEKLKINKDVNKEEDKFLIVFLSKFNGKLNTKIYDNVIDAQTCCTYKMNNFMDGYVSNNKNLLLKLKELIDSNEKYEDIEKFVNDNKIERYIKYIQRPEINKILKDI